MSTVDKMIGQRIARLRDKAGLSQAELAEKTNVQPETISRYEAGKLSAPLGRLVQIAEALGLRIQDLVRAPSANTAHDRAVDRLLLFAASLDVKEIELVMDIGGAAIKHVHRVQSQVPTNSSLKRADRRR
jgi:transcriptional regulator with XRE-family HTH domain